MKREVGKIPFENYFIYGPIFHKKEGRNMVVLIDRNDRKNRTSTSYARYLMSVKLGRKLKRIEQVDHKDNDKLNDALDNLQILTPLQNAQKEAQRRGCAFVRLSCPQCRIVFEKQKNQTHLVIKSKLFDFCSRSCTARFWRHRSKKDVLKESIENVVCEFIKR